MWGAMYMGRLAFGTCANANTYNCLLISISCPVQTVSLNLVFLCCLKQDSEVR